MFITLFLIIIYAYIIIFKIALKKQMKTTKRCSPKIPYFIFLRTENIKQNRFWLSNMLSNFFGSRKQKTVLKKNYQNLVLLKVLFFNQAFIHKFFLYLLSKSRQVLFQYISYQSINFNFG